MLKHIYIKWFFGALLLGALGLSFAQEISWVYLIYILIIWISITAWGCFDIRSNYFVKAFSSNKKVSQNHIALTFDDGPTPFTETVLDLLEVYQQKATFFCIGKQVQKYPELAKRIVNEGHVIANHTWTHTSKMGFLSKRDVVKEIETTQKVIERVTQYNVRLFRPPFGVTNPNIAKACSESGVEVVGWNIRSLDTVIASDNKILKRITSRLEKGSIVLLHDTSLKTCNTLEQLLQVMKKQKMQSVTVAQLLNIKAYH